LRAPAPSGRFCTVRFHSSLRAAPVATLTGPKAGVLNYGRRPGSLLDLPRPGLALSAAGIRLPASKEVCEVRPHVRCDDAPPAAASTA
jgi:hypothetical protein